VKLLDFGIVRDMSSGVLTQTGVIVGSIDYISPEQAHSARAVLPTADVFSMGVILYELCTGERPFKGDTPLRTLGNLAAGRYQPLDERVSGLDQALVDLVHECLAFDPLARPATASRLLERLRPLVRATLPPVGQVGSPDDSAVRPRPQTPRVVTPMESARTGRRARGAAFLETLKTLKLAMRSGLELDLTPEERSWLDQRVLVSGWYPYERFVWLTEMLHERVMGGTERAAIKMGRLAADALLTGVHSRFIYPGDVHRSFRSAKTSWTRYFDFGEVEVEAIGSQEVEVQIHGYEFVPLVHELLLQGWARAVVELSGARVRDIEVLKAPSRGDRDFVVRVGWTE